jgi:hypothetical protein
MIFILNNYFMPSIFSFYKIVSKDENIKEIYIGKTTNFKRRVIQHKSNCYNENNRTYNYKIYKIIRENGGWNNFDIIEIETNEYDNKDSAIKERELIEELNANLNIVIPSRTRKEYYEKNIEKIKEKTNIYNKKYRENNKEYFKEYFDKNIEKIKEKRKEYRENNKEIINQKAKEYYEKNIEKIKEKRKKRYEKNKDKN